MNYFNLFGFVLDYLIMLIKRKQGTRVSTHIPDTILCLKFEFSVRVFEAQLYYKR